MSKAPGTPATVALTAAGIAFTAHTYDHEAGSTDFGMEAAAKLGVDPARVFKTLVAETDAGLVVGIVPVSGMLDLRALAGVVGAKRAAMADRILAERKTGYVLGGISPIGQRSRLRTVVDASALEHATILVSGGRRGLDLELDPRDLLAMTDGVAAVIRRSGRL